MQLDKEDTERISNFYTDLLHKNGTDDAQTLNWTNKRNQLVRFNALTKIGDLQNKKILDFGCGLGDLYGFLQSNNIVTDYYGIDITPEFIEESKKKYPNGKFLLGDIFDIKEKYDYVFASGSLSFKVKDNDNFYKSIVKKLYEIADIGVAFNMLDERYYSGDEIYVVYNAEDMLKFCKTFSAKTYLIQEYVDGDFTIFMYKNPQTELPKFN
jgi:trans-aconitate methyltransferase